MPKHQASPSREERQAAKDKRAKRAEARERARKRDRVSSSSSADEDDQNTQPPPRRSPRTSAEAPAPAAAPAPAPAAAPAPAPAPAPAEVIIPKEYSPSELNSNWLVAAGRTDEARRVVHPFKDHPAPTLNAPWAECGFAEGWEPGWGWDAIPAWLRVRMLAQGFDPTNPKNVRQLEKECWICKVGNVRPHLPFSMLTPTGFERQLLRRSEVEPDRARTAQLKRCQAALKILRSQCETVSNPGAEDRELYGCCQCCAFQTTLLLREVGPEIIMRVTGNDYAQVLLVRGRLVDGEVVLENLAEHDAKLINDHLEWSATHRMWARRSASSVYCSFDVLYLGVQDLQSKCDPGLRHPRRRLDRRPPRLKQCPIGASRPKSPIDLHAGALVLALHEPGRRHPDQQQLLSAGLRSI